MPSTLLKLHIRKLSVRHDPIVAKVDVRALGKSMRIDANAGCFLEIVCCSRGRFPAEIQMRALNLIVTSSFVPISSFIISNVATFIETKLQRYKMYFQNYHLIEHLSLFFYLAICLFYILKDLFFNGSLPE